MRMKYRLAIFDFDGTLADSFPFFIRVFNQLAEQHGFKGIEPDLLTIHYACQYCGNQSSFSLPVKVQGKLVWKVDWPMRWKFEGVDFEPAGEDHSAPGSSATVGQKIIRQIFDGAPPLYVGYAFVGMAGRSKLSSSAGSNATPASALEILEPGILRWLYIRRNVGQAFDVDFGQEALRLYDEWDTFVARVREGK